MDKAFQKILQSGISLAPAGFLFRADTAPYFCTPKGASVLGWAGVDGIHFCRIRGFGEMVFAVSPMNSAPDFVHPVAKNFTDFLRLLLACGDTAALEQAWQWDAAQFAAFLRENPPNAEQRQALAEAAAAAKLTPMEHPWDYLRSVQAGFDLGKIRYTEEYYDIVSPESAPQPPAWNVYFDGGFWGRCGRERAGSELRIDKQLDWAGHRWYIPALYVCSKGLVIDLCMQVQPEALRRFTDAWALHLHNDAEQPLPWAQRMQLEAENPLCFPVSPELALNGQPMPVSRGCSVSFNPYLPDGEAPEARQALAHYGLDLSYGWTLCRESFPWPNSRRQKLRALTLTLTPEPKQLPGPAFRVRAPGDQFTFFHPIDKTEYTLTVQTLEQQTVPQPHFGAARWFYPANFLAMHCTLSPETDERIDIRDCAEGDQPLECMPDTDEMSPDSSAAAHIGIIIGGADGPAMLITGDNRQPHLHAACSSLYFEPVQPADVKWRLVFCLPPHSQGSFPLL